MESNQLLMIILALIFLTAGAMARPLIELNLWVYKKAGLPKLATFWQHQISWWRPAMRWFCFIAGAALLISSV
jgi:hypothetical protein